jgi:hypothetical protein
MANKTTTNTYTHKESFGDEIKEKGAFCNEFCSKVFQRKGSSIAMFWSTVGVIALLAGGTIRYAFSAAEAEVRTEMIVEQNTKDISDLKTTMTKIDDIKQMLIEQNKMLKARGRQ